MEFEIIGMIILFVVVIVVGIAIVTSFSSFKTFLPTQFKNAYTKIVTVIGFKSPFNICESFAGQKISLQDFQTLLQALYNGQCGDSHANVSLSFSLSKSDLQRIAVLDGIALNGKLIFYNISSPLGIGAIIVQGEPGQYPLTFEDVIDMSRIGSPIADVLIQVSLKGCNPYDDVCDANCVFKKICDPVCDDGSRHNIACNLACIDINGNGVTDEQDAQQRISQGKCNPDCYVNYTNPFKAYDPGCVWKYKSQNDDICDPNSNGVKDGICDPDCVKTKNTCDPDCNGTVSEGNPFGLKDEKCFVCDKTCNGQCSPNCKKNALPGDSGFDPDCYSQNNPSYFCSGDGICDKNKGENCENSGDCPGGGLTCGDYHAVCCPAASDADVSGCTSTTNLEKGKECNCGTQCSSGLTCDETNHCCPEGETWDGTTCGTPKYTILFIQLNGKISNFKEKATKGKDNWVQKTPLQQCPNKVAAIVVDDKVCTGVPDNHPYCVCELDIVLCKAGYDSFCQPIPSDCANVDEINTATVQMMENCAKQWGYDGKYTRLEGVFSSSSVCEAQAQVNGKTAGITVNGYTVGYYSSLLVSGEGSIDTTSSHEMGHTYGLCDESYGIEKSSSCPNGWKSEGENYCCPNAPDGPCIMCAYTTSDTGCKNGPNFAQDDYNHLELELIQKNNYCGS